MKRVILVFVMSVLLCVMAGCNTEGVDPTGPEPSVSSETDVSEEPYVTSAPIETTPVEYKSITLTEDHIDSMRSYLGDCKYIVFTQEMENGYSGQDTYSLTQYSLSVNVAQKIHSIQMRYITVDGVNREGVGYKIYSDGKNVIVSEDGVWKEADAGYETLAWDLSNFDDAWDVFSYLLHDIELPVGVEGISTGELWTFEFSEPAVDSLLAGIEYDTLLDADYKFTFRNVGDRVSPDSVSIRVEYTIGDIKYYVASTIQVNSLGNTSIIVPEIGTES